MQPNITLIACISENNVIGNNGKMIFHIPEDLKYFQAQTMFHPIIMGRKTHESIGKFLGYRANIVVTSQNDYSNKLIRIAVSLSNAISQAKDINDDCYSSTHGIFIIGGGEIYRQAMEFANKLLITRVHKTVVGDTFFPEIDKDVWELIDCKIGVSKTFKHDFFYETYMLRK